MIEAIGLTKSYGGKVVVDDLGFTVRPGVVTGFLGPNGSGKSTTMRMVLGLDRPDAGQVLIDGRPFREHGNPLGVLGAMLDAKAVHTGRSAFRHLQAIAATAGIPDSRVREVLEMVGLREIAGRRVGGFSLGMGQRLGIAAALLGNPTTVMFDEPVNGLDPDGILWVRTLVRQLAQEGRAVFISSHLMSEMALTADHLVVIGRGRLIADEPVGAVLERMPPLGVTVRCPQVEGLRDVVEASGGRLESRPDGSLVVAGLSAEVIGDAAAVRGIPLHELTPIRGSLEDAFMHLTSRAAEYRGVVVPRVPSTTVGPAEAHAARTPEAAR